MDADAAAARALYLDLLRDTLVNAIYGDPAVVPLRGGIFRRLFGVGYGARQFDAGKRETGRDWPSLAHSMIGTRRMQNLRLCAEDVIRRGVPGDFIETGVWRGGACIMMRGVLKAYGVTDRRVWLADSFAGLPPPDAARNPADKGDDHHEYEVLAVGRAAVEANFARYGLLDDQVRFLEGWFRDTLPAAPIDRLAILRLDGDMYESTMDALRPLYPRVSPGGYVIVDDYHAVPACRKAVHDYLDAGGLRVSIEEIDGTGVFWRVPD